MLKVTSPLETRELELPAEGEVLYCCISQLILLIQGTEIEALYFISSLQEYSHSILLCLMSTVNTLLGEQKSQGLSNFCQTESLVQTEVVS